MKHDKPSRIVNQFQGEIDCAISLLVSPAYLETWLLPRGYVVGSSRGRSYSKQGAISVPLWAYRKGTDYFLYYAAHELSHLFSMSDGHDFKFYQHFMRICPIEFQHFELGYKPSAKKYGIRATP